MNAVTTLNKPPVRRWYALLMNALAYGYFFMTVNVINAMTSQVQTAFGITSTELTFMTTAVMISFAIVPTFGAQLASKIGGRNIVSFSFLWNVAVTLLFLLPAVNQHYAAIIVIRLLHGATGGLMTGTVVGSTPLWFPIRERGLASGLNLGILGVGFAVDQFFAPKLFAAGLSWSTALVLIIVIPGVILGLIYYLTMRDIRTLYGVDAVADALPDEDTSGHSTETLQDDRPATMSEAYKSKTFWATAVYGFVNGWVVYGFTSFLPSMLTNDMGIAGSAATNIISATYFVTFIASPLGGIISDKVFKGKRYQLLALGCMLTVITLLAIPHLRSIGALTLMFILAYGSTSIVCGTFWTLPTEIVKPSISVKSSASVMTVANIGGVIAAPILVSVTAATGTNMMSSYICIVLAIIAAAAALVIKK
ncbi:MAG: MFS transporter [Eubacteriaceae bacterium]|jgi:nitrate/nitrite transporter NarK|nr:MFS transporter [Eubacteriaceae bacterium]